MQLEQQLVSGLQALGEDPARHPCSDYLAYLDLLEKWNKAYNLSGIREKSRMLTHHLLDSLSVLPHLRGERGLDVGSGAGLPGFILALARPQMKWLLLDSNTKKTRFIQQALIELGPGNIEIAEMRIEDFTGEQRFHTIISRALMPAADFYEKCQPLLADEGRILLMKSRALNDELAELNSRPVKLQSHKLQVPGIDAERYLLQLERQQTPG